MNSSFRSWLRISFLNLLIVAFLGVILRYKIAFSLPFIDQKNLHHGHSHFAFFGWITQLLMVLMVYFLQGPSGGTAFKRYRWLLYANLLTAYGMLISFTIQGYGIWSIGFSTISALVSYVFAFMFWHDLDGLKNKKISHLWFRAALVFSVLSSLGAYAEAYMMANKIIHQNWYLAAEYYFLHFQYNGWFFFAGMGLLVSWLEKISGTVKKLRLVFWLFGLACVPAYFLSALWMPIPAIVYWLVVGAAIAQVAGWIQLVQLILKNGAFIKTTFCRKGRWLLLLSAIALTAKLLLQLGSTHPALSQLAFGFRPIVIGYLHLVLLGVFTIFLVGYIISLQLVPVGKYFGTGVILFVSGIIINEVLLMLQGVTGMSYTIVPYMDELLLLAAVIMFSGIAVMNLNARSRKNS